MPNTPKTIKVALLDLYNGQPNNRIQSFQDILSHYGLRNSLQFETTVFAVRDKAEIPSANFDLYISTGGPGSPIDSEGSRWERNFFNLFEQLESHNAQPGSIKKHSLLICHSFQLMCRHMQLGEVNRRHELSYGVVPVQLSPEGQADALFKGLPTSLPIFDSRYWQVIHPDERRLAQTGARVLAVEDAQTAGSYPAALTAVRFSPYISGTQFHPETEPWYIWDYLQQPDKAAQLLADYGPAVYENFTAAAADENLLSPAYDIIPNFLDEATAELRV